MVSRKRIYVWSLTQNKLMLWFPSIQASEESAGNSMGRMKNQIKLAYVKNIFPSLGISQAWKHYGLLFQFLLYLLESEWTLIKISGAAIILIFLFPI